MAKIATRLDSEMLKENNAPITVASIVMLIVGAVGLVAYIVSSLFFEGFLLDVILWVSAFLLVFGITFLVSVKRSNKQLSKNNYVNVYEFFDEYFTEESIQNGEIVATGKRYYADITKITGSKNYLFIFINKINFLPLYVSALTKEDYDYIVGRFYAYGKHIKRRK